jgi:hypothetical protein
MASKLSGAIHERMDSIFEQDSVFVRAALVHFKTHKLPARVDESVIATAWASIVEEEIVMQLGPDKDDDDAAAAFDAGGQLFPDSPPSPAFVAMHLSGGGGGGGGGAAAPTASTHPAAVRQKLREDINEFLGAMRNYYGRLDDHEHTKTLSDVLRKMFGETGAELSDIQKLGNRVAYDMILGYLMMPCSACDCERAFSLCRDHLTWRRSNLSSARFTDEMEVCTFLKFHGIHSSSVSREDRHKSNIYALLMAAKKFQERIDERIEPPLEDAAQRRNFDWQAVVGDEVLIDDDAQELLDDPQQDMQQWAADQQDDEDYVPGPMALVG